MRLHVLAGVALLVVAPLTWAQTAERHKAGVVKITSTVDGARRTGTGFVVRLDANTAYILTASHVVEGDDQPQVVFFSQPNLSVKAGTAHIEGGNPRGLALLIVRGKENLPRGVSALPLGEGTDLRGGEAVVAIGFPRGAGPWAIVRANVVGRDGLELTLDGSIDEGNSGGPVLRNDTVVGIVTTLDGRFGRAVPAALARIVLQGWGVRPASSVPAEEPPSQPAEQATPQPRLEPSVPAKETAATSLPREDASVTVQRALCERLRAGTSFRVTLTGEAQGPTGAIARVALMRDGKEMSSVRTSCREWNECERRGNEPDKTRFSASAITVGGMPSEAAVMVVPSGGSEQAAYAMKRVELNCLGW